MLSGFTQHLERIYERSEDLLGRSWPIWVAAICFYVAFSWVLLTKVRFPEPIYLVVFVMAAVIVTITVARIEWAILGLCAMIAFTRPGVSFGPGNVFHVSGFNLALIGVWFVYIVRYSADRAFAAKGPLIRKTPLDNIILMYLVFVTLAMLVGLNKNWSPYARARVMLYWKEQVLYFAWFYLVVTFLRSPRDIRNFAMVFATAGLFVAGVGLYGRFGGAVEAVHATAAELEAGVVGGRSEGAGSKFLGLGHPNFLGAFLIMSMPIWFFAVDHLKRWYHKLLADAAILLGLLGLLFTYSRSAWFGVLAGIGMLGLSDHRALKRIVVFIILFAIVAQGMSLLYTERGVVELVSLRFEQLNRSDYSARPAIFRSALEVIGRNPITGVGPGAFPWHADNSMVAGVLSQAHNLLLTIAAEDGIPAALFFIAFFLGIFKMALRNLRALARLPGFGFIAQGAYAGFFAIVMQTLFVHLFHHRNVGYALYALLAIIVALDRMVQDGKLPIPEAEKDEQPSTVWVGS
ncbi:O-antigen ligase family protein [bacterium]|nr:O-antigen ligase family protein [bacterium]